MSIEDTHRNAIALHPLDTTPRLIFADWLDEDGRPEEARDQRLHAAQQRICEDPASDAARLEWCNIAESVPVDEGGLAEVRRRADCPKCGNPLARQPMSSCPDLSRCSVCRYTHGPFWQDVLSGRAREAALARTVSLHRRADFIRVQVGLAKMKCDAVDDNAAQREWCVSLYERGVNKRIVCGPCHKIHEPRERERELLKENVYEWTPRLLDRCQLAMESDCAVVLYTTMPPQSVRLQFARGFIDSITCDWSMWVQHAQRCAWRPGWTEACGWCGGDGLAMDAKEWGCLECGGNGHMPGTGRTPRAFTGSEIPATKLVLTTIPEYTLRRGSPAGGHQLYMSVNGVEHPVTTLAHDDERFLEWFAAEWPGLEVTLPGQQ